MPELPEVEAVARDLAQRVSGMRIVSAELRRERLAPRTTPDEFARLLSNARIIRVHRRGKYILIDLDTGRTLIVHLRMSGRFMLLGIDDHDPKFVHALFRLDDDRRLVFDDQRHFGLMAIADTSQLAESNELRKLAPEPLSEEFSPDYFAATLRSSNRTLKEILLDQAKVCGVGNIYACEAMFLAGIDPRRRGRNLSVARCTSLHESIRLVLNDAIEISKSLEKHPSIVGEGAYGPTSVSRWHVYGREGEPCPKCSAPIGRCVQGGRSTYFCRKCQR